MKSAEKYMATLRGLKAKVINRAVIVIDLQTRRGEMLACYLCREPIGGDYRRVIDNEPGCVSRYAFHSDCFDLLHDGGV